MSLVSEFVNRIKSDGLTLTLHLTFRYLTGINLINLYNTLQFREHRISTSCDISVVLSRTTQLPHPIGIVIGHEAEVGLNVRIQQHVTLGRSVPEPSAGYPTIGDDVVIGTGATVLGDITVGEGATIGANSVVLDDVLPGATVAGAPAEEI